MAQVVKSFGKLLGFQCKWPQCNFVSWNNAEHERHCKYRLVRCKWAHCKTRLVQSKLTTHEECCDLRKVACKWPDCNELINHYYIEHHEDDCPKRISNGEECTGSIAQAVDKELGNESRQELLNVVGENVGERVGNDVASGKHKKNNGNAAKLMPNSLHDNGGEKNELLHQQYLVNVVGSCENIFKYEKHILNDKQQIEHIIEIATGNECLEMEESDGTIMEEASEIMDSPNKHAQLISQKFERNHNKIIEMSALLLNRQSKRTLPSIEESQEEFKVYKTCQFCEDNSCCEFTRRVVCWIPGCKFCDKISSFRTHLLENHEHDFVQNLEVGKTLTQSPAEVVWYMGVEDKLFHCWARWCGRDVFFDAKFLGPNFLAEQWKLLVTVGDDGGISTMKTVSSYGGCITIRSADLLKTFRRRRRRRPNDYDDNDGEIKFTFRIVKLNV